MESFTKYTLKNYTIKLVLIQINTSLLVLTYIFFVRKKVIKLFTFIMLYYEVSTQNHDSF